MKMEIKKYVIGLLVALIVGTSIFAINWYRSIEDYKRHKIQMLVPPFPDQESDLSSKPAHQPVSVMFFGDSRARAWDDKLLNVTGLVKNTGINEDVTPRMLNRLENDVILAKPEWVVVSAGINDLVSGSMMESQQDRDDNRQKVIENITTMTDKMVAAGAKVIVLTISPPLQPDLKRRIIWGNHISDDVDVVNEAIKRMANKSVIVIDTMASFKSAGPEWMDVVRLDTLHFTQDAYKILSEKAIYIMNAELQPGVN